MISNAPGKINLCMKHLWQFAVWLVLLYEDIVGESCFVVYGRRIWDAELFAVCFAHGCVGCLARLT